MHITVFPWNRCGRGECQAQSQNWIEKGISENDTMVKNVENDSEHFEHYYFSSYLKCIQHSKNCQMSQSCIETGISKNDTMIKKCWKWFRTCKTLLVFKKDSKLLKFDGQNCEEWFRKQHFKMGALIMFFIWLTKPQIIRYQRTY